MPIMGLRPTDQVGNPGDANRPGSWRSNLLRLYPYGKQMAPLSALTALMKSEATTDPIYHWFRKITPTHRLLLTADLSGGNPTGTAQNIAVADESAASGGSSAFTVKAGDVLMVEHTGELLYVNQTPTTPTVVNVLRGFENANSQAIDFDGANVNPYVIKIGSAYEEGSAAPDPIGWDPEEASNQTQIFRETFGLTGSAMATATRTGETVRESKTDAWEAFQVGLEKSFIFGKRRTTVRNGKPLRMTNGILNMLPSTRKISVTSYDANGLISMSYWETLFKNIFRYGSSEKVAWCGLSALLAVTQAVRLNASLNWDLGKVEKEYGMDIQRLRTPMGTLVLKIHPLFGQMVGGENPYTAGGFFPGLDNAMLILDMGGLRYRYLTGRDVKYENNLQLPGVDGLLAGWIAECGLELDHPETHLFLTGIRGGKVDP
jgi:hypothetical protein